MIVGIPLLNLFKYTQPPFLYLRSHLFPLRQLMPEYQSQQVSSFVLLGFLSSTFVQKSLYAPSTIDSTLDMEYPSPLSLKLE